jgi:hypothetical protein
MEPDTSEVNLTPTSIADESLAEGTAGVAVLLQRVKPLFTVTVTPAEGLSIFKLSSVARLFSVTCPLVLGDQA